MKANLCKLPRQAQFLSGTLLLVLSMLLTGSRTVHANEPQIIDITAKRFAFTPNQITVKKGKTLKLRLHSEDVTHGFFSRPLKIDEEVDAGGTTEIALTPQATGSFLVICDHFCGVNHGNMNMTVVVE